MGRVYEYFLGKFAASEGKGGGEFYTPKAVVTLLAEMLEPYQGKIYDPAVVQAVCSCSPSSLSKAIRARARISPSTARADQHHLQSWPR